MSTYSNWREDLIEVIDTPTTEKKAEKKVKETKVNNKVVINPTFKEAVAEMGGQILEVAEVDDKKDTAGTKEDPQIKSKEKRAGMIKRQVLLKKLQAVRAGGGTDITAGYEPEGDQLDERLGGKGYSRQAAASSVYPGKKGTGDWEDSDRGAGNKAARRAGKKVEKKSPTYRAHVLNKEGYQRDPEQSKKDRTHSKQPDPSKDGFTGIGNMSIKDIMKMNAKMKKEKVKEGYEEKKTSEVLAAFKRDPKVRKRFEKSAKKEDGPGSVKNRAADDMLQTAKDTAKRKGDTSKSDDRYAYESAVLDANTKISNKEKRDKLKKELVTLTKRAKAMKKHGSGYHPFLHDEEVEVEEGYGKIKTPEKVVGKVRQPKKVAAPKGSKLKVDEGIMKMVKKVVKSRKPEKKAEKAMDAGARAKRQLARQVHAKYVSGSEDNVPDDIRDHYEVNERTLASYIPSDRQGEVHRANLDYTKAQLKKREDESTKNRGDLSKRDAGKMAKERLRTKKIMSMGEAKVDKGRSDYGKASIRNYRRSGPGHGEPAMFDPENKRGKLIDKRREEHKARRGVKGAKVPAYKKESYEINPAAHKAAQKKTKMRNLAIGNENPNEKAAAEKKAGGPKLVGEEKKKGLDGKACWKGYKLAGTKKKGGKTVDNCVKEEDKAFNFVVNKLKSKYGDGVLTKGDKMPELSAAQKKKNAEIRAKRAKEDHRDPTEKASDGRYSDRYSNRGSD